MVLLAKLEKPLKLIINIQEEDGGEIESFSLLKLSLKELVDLIFALSDNNMIEYRGNSIIITYSGNDKLHKKWKDLAVEHRKLNPSNFIDVSKKYTSEITGTSCLIRDPNKHIIRIALRNNDNNCCINRICIDNDIREKFFNDVKSTQYYFDTGKYAMDTRDFNTYSYWSKYMNTSFIYQSTQK